MKNTILTSESWTGDPVNSQVPTSARRFARRSSLVHPPQGKIPAIVLAANRRMQTNRINILGIACAALAFFTAGTSMAADNTGSGGTITYTDAGGLNPVASPPYANGYVVHTFTNNSDTLLIPANASADVLVVGGGGGGGASYSGGGGAGGLIYRNAFSVAANSSYTVTVGSGGAGGFFNASYPTIGGDSTFDALIALGGGYGGNDRQNGSFPARIPSSGGSGGGGTGVGAAATQPSSGSLGFGNSGGTGSSPQNLGGGGGGAGSAGGNGPGGNGLQYSISGTASWYAGGGGGWLASGGSGIGGSGLSGNGTAGAINTGSGGGGAAGGNGGAGGSGIVIVKYPYALIESTPTLVSIVDNKSGGPIVPTTLVTYTVTFSLDMDAGTVDLTDFGNAGSAAVTIGAVTETSPGVFTVEVTPTTGGSLILKVNASAVLNGADGTPLNTTSAIPDDTTITVDATPPTLTSIVDDKSGGSVIPSQLVTYTVTFSEDMDASTVSAASFGNAGTAAVTIGTVTETTPTSGVFTVPVTATTIGTLQLMVNLGAVLNDAMGNALDTTSAILDDTTITVDVPPGNSGSGGTITYTDAGGALVGAPVVGGDVIHTFTNSGTLNIPIPASADVLVVGGGGGGGAGYSGGGGAGGLIYRNAFSVAANSSYTVTVGSGGAQGVFTPSSYPTIGGDSTFGALIALGGGYGGQDSPLRSASSGGSGGGDFVAGAVATQPSSGSGGFGNSGGISGSPQNLGGGGGGAGSAGGNGPGGNGLQYSISGTASWYAGGGGGWLASGGSGIGGSGLSGNGTAGAINTGSGGGGAAGGNGGAGGSGIVIVRYPYADSGSPSSPYSTWANGANFNDPNSEGIAYGMAWMLGGGTSTSPSVGLLPAVVPGSGLTLHFKRVHDQGAAKLYFQYSSDLATWDPELLIPENAYGTDLPLATGITATITEGDPDDVTVTVVPAGHEAGGKLFGRLKATEN